MLPNICFWVLVLLTFQSPAILCVSHGDYSASLNHRPANLFHVLRFARTREVNNNPRSLPPNVVEETRFINKEEGNGRAPPSFTIISWIKSLVEPLSYRRNAEEADSTYRRGDMQGASRIVEPSQSRKFGSITPPSSDLIPKGYFTVSKGVVKFIPMPSTTPRAVTYFVKNNNLVPTYGASNAGLTAAARLSDPLPTIVKDAKHRDGFFTVKNGQVRFHPLTADRGNLDHVTSGTGRRADSADDFTNNFMDELLRKPQNFANKVSSSLLRSKIIGGRSTSISPAANEMKSATGDPANRLPTVRMDDDTLFVPSTPSVDGHILFNRKSISDYLRQRRLNSTAQTNSHKEETAGTNILLSQMEALYPGFSEIVRDKSQIVIQNVFLTPLINRLEAVNKVSPIEIQNKNRNRLPIVLTNDAALYVPTETFNNGTVVFERYDVRDIKDVDIERHSTSLAEIEKFYPGFAMLAGRQPPQIIIHTSIITVRQSHLPVELSKDVLWTSQSLPIVRIDNETVYVPAVTSSNGTLVYSKQKMNNRFRKGSIVSVEQIETYYPGFGQVAGRQPHPDQIVINNAFIVPKIETQEPSTNNRPKGMASSASSQLVTASSTDVAEEQQVKPPVSIKNQHHFFTFKPKPSVNYWQRPRTTTEPPTTISSTTTIPPTTGKVQDRPSTIPDQGLGNEVDELVKQLLGLPNLSVTSGTQETSSYTRNMSTRRPIDWDAWYAQYHSSTETPQSSSVTAETADAAALVEHNQDVLSISSESAPLHGFQTQAERLPIVHSKPVSSISSSNNGSSNFASLVLAHTAALMAGKPSPFATLLQSEVGLAAQAETLDSIVAQLTSPEKNEDQVQPETASHVPPPNFLADQVYPLAQTLNEFESDSSDDEVSESVVEAPVTQALVTTIVNHINTNNDPSVAPDKLEQSTDSSVFLFEPIYTVHKKRPSSASKPSGDVTDTTPSDSFNEVATSSFHMDEPPYSNETQISISQLQSIVLSETDKSSSDQSTSEPVVFVTMGHSNRTSTDANDLPILTTLAPEAGLQGNNVSMEHSAQNATESTLSASSAGVSESAESSDSSTQTASTTDLETQITEEPTNHMSTNDPLETSSEVTAINTSPVVYPQNNGQAEESTSNPIGTPSMEILVMNEPVQMVHAVESTPLAYFSATNDQLTTEGTTTNTPVRGEIPTTTNTVDEHPINSTGTSTSTTDFVVTTQTIESVTEVPQPVQKIPSTSRPQNYFSCGGESFGEKSVFVSPKYPEPDVDQGRCTFRLKIASKNICQVRVQFNDSRMLLPREGDCIDQFLSVSGSIVLPGVERFCGKNTDQHFYLDLTEAELVDSKPRSIEFHVITKARGFPYRYAVNIQQIDCSSESNEIRAPRGCLQYYPHPSGVMKSFNYEAGQYYNNVNYRICLRSASQTCALALAAPDGQFGLHKANSGKIPRNRSGVGSRTCVRDYLFIPAGSRSGKVEAINEERYCGAKLSPVHGDKRPRVIIVPRYGNVYSMEFRTGTPRKFLSNNRGPGFRVSFAHIRHCETNQSTVSHLRLEDVNDAPDKFERIAATLFDQADEIDVDREFSEDFYDSGEEPVAHHVNES